MNSGCVDAVPARTAAMPRDAAVSSALDRAGFAIVSTAMQDCLTDPDTALAEDGITTDELEKLFMMLA